MKRKIKIIPTCTVLPLVLSILINCIAFNGTRLITANMHHYDLSIPADGLVPFVPAFIIIYVLAYIQWAVGFLLLCRSKRELFCEMIAGEIVTKIICAVIFIAMPTIMARPDVTGGGLLNGMVNIIYTLDTPDNLFPSLHCVESWFCFRCAVKMKGFKHHYSVLSLIFTILVFASVVFVKQHRFLDIIGGIIVLEAGMFISKKLGAKRLIKKLCSICQNGDDSAY